MSEDITRIIEEAKAEAKAAVERAAAEARERASRPQLPAVEAEPTSRAQPAPREQTNLEKRQTSMTIGSNIDADSGGGGGGSGGGTIEVVVVDNGEFKKGDFYIDGELTAI